MQHGDSSWLDPRTKREIHLFHLSIVGHLLYAEGKRYILNGAVRFSRWPEAVLITDIWAKSVAHEFVTMWVRRFSVPTTVTTGKGRLFKSAMLDYFSRLLGITDLLTIACDSLGSGIGECLHRQNKAAFKIPGNALSWTEILSLLMPGIRSALKRDLGRSVAATCGTAIRVPGEFLDEAKIIHPV